MIVTSAYADKKKQISLHHQPVEYTLRISRRARRLRLVIYCDGRLVVTAPLNMSDRRVEQFIIKKSPWIIDKLEYFKKFSGRVFPRGGKKEYRQFKALALVLARRRLEYFNQIYGFKYNKINIKNQKTRWGSCSKKGNLNFNYKIVLLPERLADYIIIHELCHLKELNHSPKFWDLVATARPDYLEARWELRRGFKK